MAQPPLPELPGVTHHFADAGGVEIHYAQAGPQDGEPVLLVHGWPQHWWCWRKVIPTLSDRHRVIAMDLRGYGWSEAPDTSYAKEEFADDILGLIAALDLRDVRLVGHDWGGAASFLACLRAPELFRSYLALSINHPWPVRNPGWRTITAALSYQPLLATPGLGSFAQRRLPLYRAVYRVAGGKRIWTPEEIEVFAATFREPARARAASRTYRSFLTREMFADASRGRRLEVPTRLVYGDRDPVITAKLLERGKTDAADFTIERVSGGHFLPEEHPELIAERLD